METLGWKRRFEELRGEVGLVASGSVDLGSLSFVLAAAYGDRPAIDAPAWPPGLEGPPVRSYRALDDAVARLAAAHDALGNHRAARVAIAVANRIDVLLHVLALVRAGAVPVPVNTRLKPAELREVILASRAAAIVMDGDLVASLVPSAIASPDRNERGRVKLPMASGEEPLGERIIWSGAGAPPKGVRGEDLAAWLRAHPDARLAPTKRIHPAETALLLCTSGTTGHPKVAALTSEGLLRVPGRLLVAPVGRDKGLRAGRDVVICALPLAHAMGIGAFLNALCAGTKLLHLERFDAATILRRIESERPNVFIGVPTMYADLESEGAARRDLSSVQLWVSAADVMPPERARRFQRYGAAGSLLGKPLGTALFADVYGMVELSGAAALRLYPASPLRDVDLPAVAFTLPGFEVRVVDEEGKPLSWGATGALQIRGPSVLRGYEGAPEAGPSADGWFPTGDLARVWPGGFFAFAGRSRDRLKVSGFSVFPAEVETILREHPEVAEVVLVGVPDDRTGDRPVALVIPKGEAFDAEAFVAWAGGKVAAYRRPRAALVVKALPRGNHGKIDRAAATRLAVERLAEST
jgi:acyl-CoA synthetase (AMP-forming)/AMP-acid ligase II